MTIYDEMQQVATELLTDFNQATISLVTVTPGNGPAHNPGPSAEVVTALKGAVARGVKFKYVQRGLAVASDLQVTHYVHPTVTPAMNGFVDINGQRLKIVHIEVKPASGTPVAYTLIVRKG